MYAQYTKISIWVEYRVNISPLYRLLLPRYAYMQQYVDGPTATPTHLYVHYIAAIDIYACTIYKNKHLGGIQGQHDRGNSHLYCTYMGYFSTWNCDVKVKLLTANVNLYWLKWLVIQVNALGRIIWVNSWWILPSEASRMGQQANLGYPMGHVNLIPHLY
jgi:hypothetical protein